MKRNRISRTETPRLLVHVTGDRIGDALIKWPVIDALAKALPEHRLIWMAGRRRSVFAGPLAPLCAGVIDEVRDFAGVGVSWAELLNAREPESYSIVMATEQKLRSAIILKRLRSNTFISPALGFRFSDRKPDGPYPLSVFDQLRCLAELAAGRSLSIDAQVRLAPALQELAQTLLPNGPNYIGFVPGAAGVRKRWPLPYFIALARIQAAKGRTPVFFLGPQELSWRAELADAVPQAIFPEQDSRAATHGGPLLSIALARRIRLGVANDCGGGHLLAAGGRPLISLFGRTDADKFRPPYGRRIVISAREYGGQDMAIIPVQRVDDEMERLIVELER